MPFWLDLILSSLDPQTPCFYIRGGRVWVPELSSGLRRSPLIALSEVAYPVSIVYWHMLISGGKKPPMIAWSEVAFAWTQFGNSNSNSAVQDPPGPQIIYYYDPQLIQLLAPAWLIDDVNKNLCLDRAGPWRFCTFMQTDLDLVYSLDKQCSRLYRHTIWSCTGKGKY